MRTLVVAAFSAAFSAAAIAGQIPAEMLGRWSDADCNADVPVLQLSPNRVDISRSGKTMGSLIVDAQGQAASRLNLRTTKILAQTGGGEAHVGDVVAIRLDGDQLLFLERVVKGRRLPINDKPLSRCGS